MTDQFDPFAGDTGLKDDYDGTIIEAWFSTSSEYNNGQTLLFFAKVAADDGDEEELRYPCGPDWGSFDGGETAEHPKGDKKTFNNRTAYFQFINAAMSAGGEDDLRRRSEGLGNKGPMAAALWVGTRWHFEVHEEPMKFRDRTTGEMIERVVTRTLPTKYLGEKNGDTPTVSTTAPASAPTGGSSSDPLAALSPTDQAIARAKAKELDHGKWVEAVLTLPGAVTSDILVASLGDENGLYATLRNE